METLLGVGVKEAGHTGDARETGHEPWVKEL